MATPGDFGEFAEETWICGSFEVPAALPREGARECLMGGTLDRLVGGCRVTI